MSILKFLGKAVRSIIPFGGVVSEIISPDKTIEEKREGLELLDPIAQYNRTMARPRIALSIVYTYLIIILINVVLFICKQPQVPMPDSLLNAFVISVGAYIGSRGLEKIAESIFKKKKVKK